MHVGFRLGDDPLRLYRDLDDEKGWLSATSIVGGARDSAYLRDISQPSPSVGAQLLPGAALFLFGIPADELSFRHTNLEDLLGSRARSIRDELSEARLPERRIEIFESFLAKRISENARLHPAISMALRRFEDEAELSEVVRDSGHSHRHFISLFRSAVGLSPKRYLRIARFQRALVRMQSRPTSSLSHVAIDTGYSDQSHFTREFRAIANISPSQYRELAPKSPNHVRLVKILQDEEPRGRQSRPRLPSRKD